MNDFSQTSPRILVVDDNALNRELLEGMLTSLGYQPVTAATGEQALEAVSEEVDLVLMDIRMPGMDGLETTRRLRERFAFHRLPVIMVTARDDQQARLLAVEAGANDFIAKPVDFTELRVRVSAWLQFKAAQDALQRQQETLERMVEARTTELRVALQDLREAYLDTLVRLSIAAEYKDEDTADHIHRMSRYVAVLAEGLGLPPEEVELLQHASPLHDVGKIGIPDHILLKPGKLTPEEWEIMKTHTTIGARILHGSPNEILQAGEVIALTHHERMDGTGYPRGLRGDEIPLWGRICAVADVFDALTSRRPYKPAFSNEEAYAILRESSGAHLDPQVVKVFFERLEDILEIQATYRKV